MSQRVVKDIGNYIGVFIESDANNFVGVRREFLRVRVSISLDVPLKRRMKLKKNAENWCWVNFKYEGAPTFRFICGLIGHSDKFCEKLFETPMELIERPYGVWMRAEPRRRSHTIGAKWLRPGGIFSVNAAVVDDGVNQSNEVGGKNGIILSDSNKSGMQLDNMELKRRISAGMIQGNSLAKDKQEQDPETKTQGFQNQKAENNKEGDSNEILVIDTKETYGKAQYTWARSFYRPGGR